VKRSPLVVILFVSFVDLIGFGLIIPLQAEYARRLEASAATLGAMVGVYALMQFLFTPILGSWSDRIGRRPVLLVSIGGSVLSHILLGIGDLAASLPLLFIARTVDGITGANIATAQACIADVTEGRDRARGMGLFGAAFGLGFVVGPALAALLASVGKAVSGPYGTSWPAFGAAAASLVSLGMVALFLPESAHRHRMATRTGIDGDRRDTDGQKHAEAAFPCTAGRGDAEYADDETSDPNLSPRLTHAFDGLRQVRGQPRIAELLVIFGVSTFALVLMEATFVYLCMVRFAVGMEEVGLIFAFVGAVMIIVQGGLVGRLTNRFGEPLLMTVGPFITMVGYVGLALLMNVGGNPAAWALLFFASLMLGVGRGLGGPTVTALISRHAAAGQQGAILGLSQGLGYLARCVSPPIAGALFDASPSWPYWLGAGMLLVVGVYSAMICRVQEAAIGWAAHQGATPTASC